MIDALVQVRLTKVTLDPMTPDCNSWSGLIRIAISPNGAYVGSVPFEGMHLALGDNVLATPILVYDGPGGFCGASTPEALLQMEVTVSGIDVAGTLWLGAGSLADPLLGTDPPHQPPQVFSFRVFVPPLPPGPIPPRKKAKLWFHFTVDTLC